MNLKYSVNRIHFLIDKDSQKDQAL